MSLDYETDFVFGISALFLFVRDHHSTDPMVMY